MKQLLVNLAQSVYDIINESYDSLYEYRYNDNGRKNFYNIKNMDSYNFATTVVEKYCESYFLTAAWAKGKTKKITAAIKKDKRDTVLHRAAFVVTIKSLENTQDKGETFKVLCKIYNPTNKKEDCILVDYDTIADAKYRYYATIIDGTVYYLDNSAVQQYASNMGNSAVAISSGKYFIKVDTQYWIDNSQYYAEMDADDKAKYNAEFLKYNALLKQK